MAIVYRTDYSNASSLYTFLIYQLFFFLVAGTYSSAVHLIANIPIHLGTGMKACCIPRGGCGRKNRKDEMELKINHKEYGLQKNLCKYE